MRLSFDTSLSEQYYRKSISITIMWKQRSDSNYNSYEIRDLLNS